MDVNSYPKVLISLSLEEDQWLFTDKWVDWLRSVPGLVKYAKVEGVFKSGSSLILLSLPVAMWNLLPKQPAVAFVGFVTSSNILCDNAASKHHDQATRSIKSTDDHVINVRQQTVDLPSKQKMNTVTPKTSQSLWRSQFEKGLPKRQMRPISQVLPSPEKASPAGEKDAFIENFPQDKESDWTWLNEFGVCLSDGKNWKCAYRGCSFEGTFTQGTMLRKHFERHLPKFFCAHEDCTQNPRGAFWSRKDLVSGSSVTPCIPAMSEKLVRIEDSHS